MESEYREKIFKVYRNAARKHVKVSLKDYERRSKFYKFRFKEIINLPKNSYILDLGCGEGFLLYFLEKMGFINLWGVDIGKEQIEIARKHCKKVNFVKSDLKSFLKSSDLKFDLIFMDNVLEHFKKNEISEILNLIHLKLNDSGKLIVCVPNVGSIWGMMMSFIDFTHETFFTPSSLEEILIASSFEIVKIKGDAYPLPLDFLGLIRSIFYFPIRFFTKIVTLIMCGGGGRTKILHIPDIAIMAIAKKK